MIIGLGSSHGDDQVGWMAVDRLRPRLPAGVAAVKATGGLALLESLAGQDEVIIVDAAAPGGRPGAITWLEWPCPELVERRPWSTHGPGLVEALHLAETLGSIPRRVTIATVEAAGIVPGTPLGPAAETGLDRLVEAVLGYLATAGLNPPPSAAGSG
jgi:hydrogenase maturation protease